MANRNFKDSLILILIVIFCTGVLITPCRAENNQTTIEKYFAIAKGNSWTYKIKATDDNKKEKNTSVNEITSVLKTEKYIIAETQTVDSSLKEPLFFYSIIVDKEVYSFNPNTILGDFPRRYNLTDLASWLEKGDVFGELSDRFFNYPLEVGQVWQGAASGATYTVERQEDIAVPAGEFKDCYRISYKTKSFESIDWFCPGIGSVKTEWRNTGQHKTYGLSELVEYQIR